jgi:hypothetical protein
VFEHVPRLELALQVPQTELVRCSACDPGKGRGAVHGALSMRQATQPLCGKTGDMTTVSLRRHHDHCVARHKSLYSEQATLWRRPEVMLEVRVPCTQAACQTPSVHGHLDIR